LPGARPVMGDRVETRRIRAVGGIGDWLGERSAKQVRKLTIKNAERYVTQELKEFETKVLRSEELSKDLEYQLFCELRDAVAARGQRADRAAATRIAIRLRRVARGPGMRSRQST
jgi:hypothetical protein